VLTATASRHSSVVTSTRNDSDLHSKIEALFHGNNQQGLMLTCNSARTAMQAMAALPCNIAGNSCGCTARVTAITATCR